mmetsp:Transcript_116010/g.247978  ORF Transcript_116010/g.247978 Transcript_116010/m.247978 type:complete len:882 (+) Transcript_116010:63-2708(+)
MAPKSKKLAKAKPGASPRGGQAKLAVKQVNADVKRFAEELFLLADTDGSGSIQFNEFLAHHHYFMSLSAMDKAQECDDDTEKQFRATDQDGNQSLSQQEFECYCDGVFGVLGKRAFIDASTSMIEEIKARRAAEEGNKDRVASERLIELSEAVKDFYKEETRGSVESFLQARADVNRQSRKGDSLLVVAADRADGAFIAQLLEARANPLIHNKEFECAALKAARARNMSALEVLMLPKSCIVENNDTDAVMQEQVSQQLVTIMQEANTTPQNVQELLSKKAEINFKDDSGWTPLTRAVFHGRRDLVEELIKAQSKFASEKLRLQQRNGRGRAALHVAARKGHADIIPLLVSARGDPDNQDSEGWTPLHHAAFNGMDACVDKLLGVNANLHVKGRNGYTPYMCTRLKTRAGSLSERTVKLLEPSPEINFAKSIVPILKDEDLTTFDKLDRLVSLRGVSQMPQNLRLYEQFFDATLGPNKIRLQKVWESLALPMIRRLRNESTDLEPPGSNLSEEAVQERLQEIAMRKKDQKRFVLQWLHDTQGPRSTADWTHENRSAYGEELNQVVAEELAAFRLELDAIYERLKQQEGGDELAAMPTVELLKPLKMTQLSAHAIPVWAEQMDAAGAFEALRLVGCKGLGKEDDDSLLNFMDLVTLDPDFDISPNFWRNCYRLWLSGLAEMANLDFQQKVQDVVKDFREAYPGNSMAATFKAGPVKTYDQMKVKERKYGEATHETYQGRVLASQVLDVVRCSITVRNPKAVLALIEFFRPLTLIQNKLELVRINNRFSEDAETLQGYRNVELNVFFEGGLRAGRCDRPGKTVHVAMVGEVQILMDEYLNVRKRRHLLYKFNRGEFDWTPEVPTSQALQSVGGSSMSLHDDDD